MMNILFENSVLQQFQLFMNIGQDGQILRETCSPPKLRLQYGIKQLQIIFLSYIV